MLLTIGHSTSTLETFIARLTEHKADIVLDVRSKPRSRLAHFDQLPLQEAIEDAGIRYRFLGDRLGGVPHDPAIRARWQQGRLDATIIAHLRESEPWQEGLAEVVSVLRANGGQRVCLMCSEADPAECHRKAIALDLAAAVDGLELRHLSTGRSVTTDVGLQEIMPQ